MEFEGELKNKRQIAKEAKKKLIDSTNTITVEDTKRYRSTTEGLDKIREVALANKDRLEATAKEIPELKEYLDRGGRVTVTREYLPRFDRPRTRISLTSEGLVYSRVRKGGIEHALTGNVIAAEAGQNGAIDALGGLTYRGLVERVAKRIKPASEKLK
jgi:hypothetical protein